MAGVERPAVIAQVLRHAVSAAWETTVLLVVPG